MKSMILARVSTEEQMQEGQSIPAQLARARDYCKKNNLQISSEYQFDESSLKDHRTKFEKVIEEIKLSKEPCALVAETIDRIQRSFKESVLLLDLIKAGKVEVHFIRENLLIHKDSNSSEFLRWDMGVMFARSYVLNISDNVKRTFDLKRRNGEWIGPVPLGYKNIPLNVEKRTRKGIEVDLETAPLVEKLFTLYSTGEYSIKTLQDEANKIGLRTRNGKKIVKSALHHMLRNPFYCGKMRSKGEEYPHKYETLVSIDIFEKCQKILDSYKRNHIKRAVKPFIFRGLVKCAKCGCSITPEIKKGRYVYYSCTNYKKTCNRVWIKEEELLGPVYKVFESIQLSKEKINQIVDALKKTSEAKVKFHQEAINNLRSQYERLQNRINKLIDLLTDQSITKEEYDKKLKSYKEEQYEIGLELNRYTEADHKYYITAGTVLNLARKAREIFNIAEIDEKRKLLNFVLQNCQLNNRKLEFSLRKPFDAIVNYSRTKAMLRAVQELRTVILSGWHSYEMEAAVKMLRGEEPFTEEAMQWMETAKH